MIYLRKKSDLWWRHRVVVRKEELELEDALYNHPSAKIQKGLGGGADLRMVIAKDHVS